MNNKLTFFTQAYAARGSRILRFLNNNPKENIINSIGSKIKLSISHKQISASLQQLISSNMTFDCNKSILLTPISLPNEKEYIDFIYKEYDRSEYSVNDDPFKYFNFDSVQQGEVFSFEESTSSIEIKDSIMKIKDYKQLDNESQSSLNFINKSFPMKKIKRIGFICEKTGVGFPFQIINSFLLKEHSLFSIKGIKNHFFYKDFPAFSMIYKNDFVEEICFSEDLSDYHLKNKIIYFPFLSYPKESFPYGKGDILHSHINQLMPHPKDEESVLIISGEREFCFSVKRVLFDCGFVDGLNSFYIC